MTTVASLKSWQLYLASMATSLQTRIVPHGGKRFFQALPDSLLTWAEATLDRILPPINDYEGTAKRRDTASQPYWSRTRTLSRTVYRRLQIHVFMVTMIFGFKIKSALRGWHPKSFLKLLTNVFVRRNEGKAEAYGGLTNGVESDTWSLCQVSESMKARGAGTIIALQSFLQETLWLWRCGMTGGDATNARIGSNTLQAVNHSGHTKTAAEMRAQHGGRLRLDLVCRFKTFVVTAGRVCRFLLLAGGLRTDHTALKLSVVATPAETVNIVEDDHDGEEKGKLPNCNTSKVSQQNQQRCG